ncbi:hypothetical protein [Hymenobacter cavernae]|uniref:Uncharacterized protein n=1 Tax=Hymenobacter cavernae TaxID=2044852 RepID=A0ABQ1UQC4_9BACT|nr:hypothetical protein [Hymenobacter cavernae]GGF22271.1 hypothetical protein GCM10011383_37380 [Hymenobacter cavernae]
MAEQTNATAKKNPFAAHFKANPKAKELLVTSDGTPFLPQNEAWAKAHAKSLTDKAIKRVGTDGEEIKDEE